MAKRSQMFYTRVYLYVYTALKVVNLTAAVPRAPATHDGPDLNIPAKSPLLFWPMPPHTNSAPKVPNLSISLKSRLFGTTVMLRPAPSKMIYYPKTA